MPEAAARERILERLRSARAVAAPAHEPAAPKELSGVSPLAAKSWPPPERLVRLRHCMEAVRAEFLEATADTWPAVVRAALRDAGARTLMAGAGGPLAAALAVSSADGAAPKLLLYDRPIEEIKPTLFAEVDAGITTCLGGIAETGGLVLCPSGSEPRLLSLVPPIHVVLLDPARIWDTLWHAVRDLGWAAGMPPNAVVISGPSKTADIEQTLAYGVHEIGRAHV